MKESITKIQSRAREERSISEMYHQNDLATCSLFAGNFINFGFWEQPLKEEALSIDQRIESEKNLYRFVIKKLGVLARDKLLEVACGQGVGTRLVMAEFGPEEVHGIDFLKIQVARARRINSEAIQEKPDRIFFREGAAENIPYESSSFEIMFSIEAAQHFESLEKFANEADRVLKPGGKLAVASFFGTTDKSNEILSSMIQTIRDGIDRATDIYLFEEILKRTGFINVKVESIGKNVWHGFDKWISQGEFRNTWNRNWYKSYQEGLIDYYLITAEKQGVHS